MSYTGFDLGKTWSYWVLLGPSRFDLFYRILLGYTGFY